MIHTLRMSRKGVQVEVEVGRTQYGSPITATAAFTRADLAEVLQPLDEAVTTAVRASLDAGRTQEILDERVAEVIATQRERIVRTAKANAEAAMSGRISELEGQLGRITRENARLQDRAERLAREHAAAQLGPATNKREDG